MSNLPRLRAISWRPRLSPYSSFRPLTRLSLSQSPSASHPSLHPSALQLTKRHPSPLNHSYSTTTTSNNTQDTPQNEQHSHQSQNKPPPHFLTPPLRLLLTSLKLLALFHLLWEYLLSLAPAQGPSMLATYPVTGTWLLTSRLHRLGRSLSVGDTVTFTIPERPNSIGIKRVIGLPGDYVLIGTPGEFWHSGADPAADDALMLQVPEGHAYLVGDNLSVSRDSRLFGPVPLALIRGKVIASMHPSFTRGPFAEFQWVQNPMRRDEPPSKEEVLNARLGR